MWERDTLLGDPGGVRGRLAGWGVSLGVEETSEVLGNVSGGVRRSVVYEGATLMTLGLDAGRLLGIAGGSVAVSAYQIHGSGLSAGALYNLNVASGIEGPRSTRLFELYYQQELAEGRLNIRIGQLAADAEFAAADHAGVFINAGFGWPTLAAVALPGGGPAWPSATPGVRVSYRASAALTLLVGVYNGDPADNGAGTAFRADKGAMVIAEAQYGLNPGGLAGVYKLGGWYNSNTFADQRYGADRLSLADPASGGEPWLRRGDWAVYASIDQMLRPTAGSEDGGLAVFARVMAAPGDRNEVDLFLNAGLTWKGLLPGRADDTIGLGIVHARVAGRAAGLDRDTAFWSGRPFPVRSGETALELTWQAQLAPWWKVQPDFQYIFRPGGGIPDPTRPGLRVRDAAVFGLRTTVTF